MAGPFPDVPGRRMAWDDDQTVMVWRRISGVTTPFSDVSASGKAELNDEDSAEVTEVSGGSGVTNRLVWIFPELREIDGFFARGESSGVLGALEASADTTYGEDGTWSTLAADYDDPNGKVDEDGEYRNAITSLAAVEQRAIRIPWTQGAGRFMRAVHIYGTPSPGETPDRLLFIDEATGLEFTASYDYGSTPRGGSDDALEWRIKNNSAGLTANTIQYTAESLFLTSGGWYTHTLPGGAAFQSTRQIASIGPGTTTALITTRRVTPGDETVGPHAARIQLEHGSFT